MGEHSNDPNGPCCSLEAVFLPFVGKRISHYLRALPCNDGMALMRRVFRRGDILAFLGGDMTRISVILTCQ